MNGRERRRAAKLGDIVEIKFGRVVFHIKPGEDTRRDICFVCGKPATAWAFPERGGMAHGFASISGQIVLLNRLCEGQHATVLQLPAAPRNVSGVEAQEHSAVV